MIGPILHDMFAAYACLLDALQHFDPTQGTAYERSLLRRDYLDAIGDITCELHARDDDGQPRYPGATVAFGHLAISADDEGGLTIRERQPWTAALRGGLVPCGN